jgi:hypothetical protein
MKPNFENLLLKLNRLPVLCGRCYEYVDQVFPSKCEEKPEDFDFHIHGVYPCPDCGAMVVAGIIHPDVCQECLEGKEFTF